MAVRPKNGSNLNITLPEDSIDIEYWWDGGSSPESIEEERGLSEYDCGYLDLGTESPASASTFNLMESSSLVKNWVGAVPRVPARLRRVPSPDSSRFNKYAADRDCGICFEYAVVPCRTLCCGKLFCTEHLADWLHGPEAEGRCPNCENACSLEGGTLSLAPPTFLSSSQGRRSTLTQAIHSSFLTPIRHDSNDTLTSSRDRSHPPLAAEINTSTKEESSVSSAAASLSTCSSTVGQSVSSDESKTIGEQGHIPTIPKATPLTSSFALPWGVVSRLFSIVIFLMFLYKLRS